MGAEATAKLLLKILEIDTIRSMLDQGEIVIACGGGGIPVVKNADDEYEGIEAIIDKDFASAKLAELIHADYLIYLIILTAVEKVAINYGKPDQQWLSRMSVKEAERYIEEGQFAPGSMLPKVEAAIQFADSGQGRRALITLLEKAKEGIEGETGTEVVCC